jgi:hypothetical protein
MKSVKTERANSRMMTAIPLWRFGSLVLLRKDLQSRTTDQSPAAVSTQIDKTRW